MNPAAPAPIAAGTSVAPVPTATSPQGVASVAPTAAAVTPQLPAAPQIAATPAPVGTPNLNTASQLQNIGDYYQIPRQTTQLVNAGQTASNVANAQFQKQQAENQINITNQKNMLDPTAYQFTKNSDGSVDILNSQGDKVDIGTYAALTGANPAEALQNAGATDKASQQFIAAYNNLQTYVQDKIAAQNGDAQAQAEIQDYEKANPGLANIQLGQLQTAFMQQYGQYFGQPQGSSNAINQAGQAANAGNGIQVQGSQGGNISPTLTSLNNPASTSAYENPLYTQLENGGSTYSPNPGSNVGSTLNAALGG